MPGTEKNSGRPFRLLSSSYFFLLCISLVVSPWLYALSRFRDQLAAQAFIFLLSLPVVFSLNRHLFTFKTKRMDGWILLSAILTVTYVFISALPYRSLLIFLKFFSLVAFYFLMRNFLDSAARLRGLLWVFVSCGIFYSLIGLLQWHGFLKHDFWYSEESLASRYVNGSHFAAFLFFPLFSALILFVTSRSAWLKAALLASMLLMFRAFLLTRTRTAWLALVPATALFLWFSEFKPFLRSKKSLVPGLLLGVTGFALFLKKGVPFIAGRFREIWDGTNPPFYSLIFRADTALDSLQAIFARPWGWGLGAFVDVLPQYRRVMDRFLIDYAHNEFLQIGVDLGVAGVLFLGGFVLFYIRTAIEFLKRPDLDIFQRTAGAAFLAIAAALFLTSQMDFPLRIYANSLFLAAFLAASGWLFEFPEKKKPATSPLFFRFAAGFVLLGALFFSSIQLYAQVCFEKGLKFEKNFQWDKAEQEYGNAIAAAPLHAPFSAAFGGFFERRSGLISNREKRTQFRKRALALYEQAVRHAPLTAQYRYFLALSYDAEGRIPEAESQFRKALKLQPANAFLVLEFGYFAFKYLDTQEGVAAFEKFQSMPFGHELNKSGPCTILDAAEQKINREEDLNRLVSNGKEDFLCLGYALGRKGQWESAENKFDQALKMASENEKYDSFVAYTRNPIVEFYRSHGRLSSVLNVYRQSFRVHPEDVYIQSEIEKLETALAAPKQGVAV